MLSYACAAAWLYVLLPLACVCVRERVDVCMALLQWLLRRSAACTEATIQPLGQSCVVGGVDLAMHVRSRYEGGRLDCQL